MKSAENRVCEVYESAFIKRHGRVWRVYEEVGYRAILGSGITKRAAWETAWKNIPTKDKRSAATWRRLDWLRARMVDDGWEEIHANMDMSFAVYAYRRGVDFEILAMECNDNGVERIRRFIEVVPSRMVRVER